MPQTWVKWTLMQDSAVKIFTKFTTHHFVHWQKHIYTEKHTELPTLQGFFQKFPALYIKKHNITTVTSLFYNIVSANFNALVPMVSAAFVYQSCRRVHFAPKERPLQMQWRHCHLKNVCHLSVLSAVGTNRSRRVLGLSLIHISEPRD